MTASSRQSPSVYDLEFIESIIVSKSFGGCFTVDLPDGQSIFFLRLLLRALMAHKYGALVFFRLSQRNYWLLLRSKGRSKPWNLFSRIDRLCRQVMTVFYERLLLIVFRVEISVFAELHPGIVASFDNLGITAGSRVMPSAHIQSRVNLVNHRGFCPTICEDAFLLTGCVIIGGVTIGKGATVGANSVVMSNVPPGATVIGNPAKIVFRRQVE